MQREIQAADGPYFQTVAGEMNLMKRTDGGAMPSTDNADLTTRRNRARMRPDLLSAILPAIRREASLPGTRRSLMAVACGWQKTAASVRRSLRPDSLKRRGQLTIVWMMIAILFLQPNLALGATTTPHNPHLSFSQTLLLTLNDVSALSTETVRPATLIFNKTMSDAFGYVSSLFNSREAEPNHDSTETPANTNVNPDSSLNPDPSLNPEPVVAAAITDAAVSIHRPALNAGRIEGSLRVMSGESYSINSPFQLTGDLYAVGSPQIRLNTGANYGGTINDGGSTSPSGYLITFNSNLILPGKVHVRADALPLPTDIPTSVPAPTGTRTVNINTASDVNSIGTWSTVKDLNVTPANLVINVPPGNYNNFNINSGSRLNFTAGTYSFAGTINLNAGASIQTTGKVNINIAQALNLNQGSIIPGTNTLPGDVHLNVISTAGCSLNGTTQVTALIRCPNSAFNLNGTAPGVTGQVIANYLNINTGKISGNVSVTPPPDTVAPALSITSPANNSSTTSAAITVNGTATDMGANASGVASVTVNNVAATYAPATGNWSLANVSLTIGSNTITARAVDNSGNATTQIINITRQPPADTTAPTLAITSPANNSTTQSATISLSGTVSDAGQYASGVAQVTVNGTAATVNAAAGTWTINDFPLVVGVNQITVRGVDNAGNATVQTLNVTRQPPNDTQAPQIAITSPANNSVTQAETINVSGTVSDAGQYQSGLARVLVNGTPAVLDPQAGTWTINNVALAMGANTITARAFDNAGNAADSVITITRQPSPDTQAPALSISSPSDNSTTPDETITVSGTSIDLGANASGVAHVTVNGMEATLNASLGTWSLGGIALNVGPNTITAHVVDNAGNEATRTVTVTRQPPADTTAPTLAITSPADGTTTVETTANISGTVYDAGQYASGIQGVTVNGTAATLDSQAGNWTINGVALNIGVNTITARAVDKANNAVTQSISITRTPPPDVLPPTVNITSPANNFVSPDGEITVTGTAIDDGPYATGVRRVVVNGQPAAFDSNMHAWTATGVTLEEGSNTIRVFAEDGASTPNRSDATLNVTRHTPDTKSPTVTITSPLSALDTYDATLNVAGTALDDGLNATGVQRVTVNGRDASYNATTNQWTVTGIALAYGDNDISVIATDGAPTPNQGHANVHVTRLRIPPPTLAITNPQNGTVLAATNITVAGAVSSLSTEPLTITVNGENATINGGQFVKTVALVEGPNTIAVTATDALGQQAQSSVSVMRDLTPPNVSFVNVPASVQPGGTYQITVDATDNIGVADVELRLDGQRVSLSTSAPYQFSLAIPATYTAGNILNLSALARDLTNTTAVATAQTRTSGPGGISGYVFDDGTGYVLQGTGAQLNGSESTLTDETGAFNLVSSLPMGIVRLSKDGYTPVERIYTVSAGEGTALFDARLTPLDDHANQIGVSGGTANGDNGRLQVSFNPGTFPDQKDVRVTTVSPQGLLNLLPYGWSPVPGAVLDVRPATGPITNAQFQSPARLSVTQVAGLSVATPLVLAHYDETKHGWVALATNLYATEGGALSADLPRAGQYAFLVADTGPTAPPAVLVNQPLPAGQPADSAALDAAQATAVATPRTALFSANARSTISFVAIAGNKLPSGVSIEATFGETYNLLAGKDSVLVDRPAQDFVLYSYPAASNDQPNRLGAFFIAKPTRTDFSITELFNANVHVDIRSGRQAKLGTLIDAHGGSLRSGDGSQLTIPSNAVTGAQPVFFNDIQPGMANVRLPEGYEVVAAFDLDLTSATLNSGATISVPGITGDLSRIVVARLMTVGGQRSPKVVAGAMMSNGLLVSTNSTPPVPAGISLSGIRTSGRYVFIRIPSAFGYIKGVVTDNTTGRAASAVKVAGNLTPFIDVTGADGVFVIVGAAGAGESGANQVGAFSLNTDATGKTNAALNAQDAIANANVNVAAVPLQVESVTPAPNAQNMIATTPVTVSFNKPVGVSSITGSNFNLSTGNGNPVLGNITVLAGNRVAVFTPANTLAGSTTYKITITQAVRDIYGKPLASAYTSAFTTASVVKADDRLKQEQIRINYPDGSGQSKIVIPALSVPEGSSIVVVNNTNGSTVSAVAATAALEILIQAQVGDEIMLIIRQPDGSEYRVTQAAYRRADGFVSVGSNGGTVTSDDGTLLLAIPSGAISGQANIKMSTRTEADIHIPREGEMDPSNVPCGGGVRLEVSGNFTNQKELHLEMPAPAGVTEGQPVVFMKPAKLTENNQERDVWEVATTGKVEGGKVKSMSPPFSGISIVDAIINIQALEYYVFMPRRQRAVTGLVTERSTSSNQSPKPLANVVCVISAANGQASVIARTGPNGRFGTLDYSVASADSVVIKATDALNRAQVATAIPYLNINPITEPGLIGLSTMYAAIEFPSSEGLPETLPALLRMEGRMLDLRDGEPDTLQSTGRVLIGAHVEIKTTASPDVQQITGQLMVGGTVQRELVWTRSSQTAGEYTTDVNVDSEGSYSVIVKTHTRANVETTRATQTFNFVGQRNPNVKPPHDGPPHVVSVTPAHLAQSVNTGTRIHLEFSEPVKNLIAGQTVFVTNIATGEHLGGKITTGGLPIGANSDNISSIDLQPSPSLEGNKEYAVEVTTQVTDTDATPHQLDQLYTSPTDNSPDPFRSTFKTFSPLILTDPAPTTDSYRIATTGDLAITVTPDFGSFMHIWDISDPEKPKFLSNKFVPNYAIAFDIAEAEHDEDIIKVVKPQRREYSTIAVVASLNPRETNRPINLFIFNLENAEDAEMIGVVSLNISDSLPAYPNYIKIHHKRAYIGNSGRGGVAVVDLEEAVRKLAGEGTASWFPAVAPNGGYDQEAVKQRASYGHSTNEAAPITALSMMDQEVPAVGGNGANNAPVGYVASNKPQLISFDFSQSFDNQMAFFDGDGNGYDDRVLAVRDLAPTGIAQDVRAVPTVNLNGHSTDLAVLLGSNRLWIFDVTNPRDPHQYPSRSFDDMGLGLDFARRMEVEGTLAYVMFSDRVVVIDFSDPTRPFVSSTITGIGNGLRWLAVRDGFIYTLDPKDSTSRTANMRVSVGSTAAIVYVHGATSDPNSLCTNPVLLNRADNHLMKPAETIFRIYGHDAPQTAKVIIRKEQRVGDQTIVEQLAEIQATVEPNGATPIVKGRAPWNYDRAIDRAALYTAELILDEGQPTEFRARHVEIPFSYLIDNYQQEWGIPQYGGIGHLPYLLGGDAVMTLLIKDQNGVFKFIELPGGQQRAYGFHREDIQRSTPNLNPIPPGRYMFRLTAALKDGGAVENAEGYVTIGEARKDVRQPGSVGFGGVELESGNLALSHTDIAEIKNRGLSLSLTRYYNSTGGSEFNPLGYGWRHNYQMLLVHDPSGDTIDPSCPSGPLYEIRGGEGGGQTFKEAEVNSGAEAHARAPYQGTLKKNADESFDFFTRAHVKYHFRRSIEASSTELFNLGYMGNLTYIEEPNGNRITLSYDGDGRLFTVADSSGRKLEFTYEQAQTPLVGTIDVGSINGQVTDCNSRRFLRSLRQRFLQADLGIAWRITKVKGPGGIQINYEYDGNGNLQRVTRLGADGISESTGDSFWEYAYNPTGGTTTVNPNLDHLIKSVKSPNHASIQSALTTYDYQLDQLGRPVKTINMAEGVSYGYIFTFTNGRITSALVSDGRDNQTNYQFLNNTGNSPACSGANATQLAKTVTITAPRNAQSVITFDGYGNHLSETDPEGVTIRYRYENGNPVERSMTGGGLTQRTTATYHPVFNKQTSFTDANDQTTGYTINDRNGNVTEIRLASGRSIVMDYNSNGDLQKLTDQYGFQTSYTDYDSYGNPQTITRQTSGERFVARHQTFDSRSRQLSTADDLGPTEAYTYDALDHLIRRTATDPTGFHDSVNVTTTYLPEGQLKSMIQAGGSQRLEIANEYDGLGRMTLTTETPNGAGPFERPFAYDRNSNLTETTDRRGVKRTRTYDELNFVKSETLSGPNGATLETMTATDIDRVGNPKKVFNIYGHSISLDYDGLHRLSVRHLPGDYTEEMGYDGNGNVTSMKDRNGRTTSFVYDAVNRKKEMRDPAGRVTTWDYDDSRRMVTMQQAPQGMVEVTQEDALGRLLQREVRFGSTRYATTNVYEGRTVTTTDPRSVVSVRDLSAFNEAGHVTVNGTDPAYSLEMHYGALGGLRSSKDALGRETTFTLDGLNRATAISYPGNFTESFTYDGEGLVVSHKDRRGVESTMTYDNLRRELNVSVRDGQQTIPVESIAYSDANSTETHTDANAHATVYAFDGLHRLQSLTNADSKTKTLVYDGMNLLRESDFQSRFTEYQYDALDRVKLIKDRKGQVVNILNSDNGGYTRQLTDRRGNQHVEVYDPLGRLTSRSDGGELLARYEYDGDDNRTLMLDGLNHQTLYTYDALNRVKTVNHANVQTETFTYDAVGNTKTYNDGRGADIRSDYDELNHPRTQTDGEGNTTSLRYDGEGLLLEKTDPKGAAYKMSYEYNALRSLTKVTDARSGVWLYGYDGAQNLKSAKDALNHTVAYDYDSLNRLRQVTQPQSLMTTYGYDADNNRNSITDPKGQLTTIAYDELDRPQTLSYGNTSGAGPKGYSYGYDPENNLTSVAEQTGPTQTRNYSRSFDARNRIKTTTDPYGRTVSFDYDAANNLKKIKDSQQKETLYDYDGRNRLQTVTLPNSTQATYTWYADGLLQRVDYGAEMKREYTYDNADRLTQLTNTAGTGAQAQTQQFVYTYDQNSNRETETRKINGQVTRSMTYAYDLLDRLTSANYAAPGQPRPADPPASQTASYTEGLKHQTGFDYDAVGNRLNATAQDKTTTVTLTTNSEGLTSESRQTVDGPLQTNISQFDALNRLTDLTSGATHNVYAYDNNGNLTTVTQNDQVTQHYEYDCRDQLRKVSNGSNLETASYDYDFTRHRLSKKAGTETTQYVYGGEQVVNEYDAGGQFLNRYDLGAGDVIRGDFKNEGERYYFTDAVGSVTALAQRTGTGTPATGFASTYDYDAWGNFTSTGSASGNTLGYTGQHIDAESGLMALGNGERYYAPGLGSFIQQDSMTGRTDVPASLNRYSYAHNNPVNNTDPSGHFLPFLILAGFLIAVAIGVIKQDIEIRNGTRAQTDFSLSEAAVDTTVIGSGYRAWTGMDPVSSERLSTSRRVFEGVMTGLEVAPVIGEVAGRIKPLAQALRAARIGSEAAEVVNEGRELAQSSSRVLTTTAKEVSVEKSALSIGEEASQLSAGMSKAERAADEIVEVSGSGRRVEDFMGAARERMMETRARYGFNEVSDGIVNMARKTEQEAAMTDPARLLSTAQSGEVAYGEFDLSLKAIEARKTSGIFSGRNASVFEYLADDNSLQTITRFSGRGVGHAERIIAKELEEAGIEANRVTRIYSELEPCVAPGGYCKAMIAGKYPNAIVNYSFEYGATKASRGAGVSALKNAVERFRE
jgi:RHS repeat-associated protein